jgi:hypothetical protein
MPTSPFYRSTFSVNQRKTRPRGAGPFCLWAVVEDEGEARVAAASAGWPKGDRCRD